MPRQTEVRNTSRRITESITYIVRRISVLVEGVDSCSEKSGYIWGWGTASYFDLRKMWNYVQWHGILFILM